MDVARATSRLTMAYDGSDIKELVYQFVFAFSRLEYSLKEAGFIRRGPRSSALPDWHGFVQRWENNFDGEDNVGELLALAPKRQCVDQDGGTYWLEEGNEIDRSALSSVCLALRTVRNNLFHGGKHGDGNWDDAGRVAALLASAIEVVSALKEIDPEVSAHFLDRY